MINYTAHIKRCKRLQKTDCLRDRFTILEYRLKRRWKRELRRRGKVIEYTAINQL